MTAAKPVLTAGQVAVLRLYAAGNTYREAADLLHISERTVKRRCGDAASVLGTRHVAHTIAEALRRGLLDEEMQTLPYNTIWKYRLDNPVNEVSMPRGARILSVDEQDAKVTVWAAVDLTAEEETRTLYVVGTGNPMPEDAGEFLGTAVCMRGMLVFHVFERVSGENSGR